MAFQGLASTSALGSDSFDSIKIGNAAGGTGPARENIFIGAQAGAANATGIGNAVVGTYALEQATGISYSVAVGWKAGETATMGEYNTLLGAQAGALAENIYFNTFVGAFAGYESKVAAQNVFCGFRSGQRNATGDQNTFIGTETGQNNRSGNQNAFVGYRTGRNNTFGNANTFVGTEAGLDNALGSSNVFLGLRAGYKNSAGNLNTFVGTEAGASNQSGANNVFIGQQAGAQNQAGSRNTLVGAQAARATQNGNSNTLVGAGIAPTLVTGSGNVLIGTGADVFSGLTSNTIVVGGSLVSASHNSIVIGNANQNRKPSVLTIGNEIQTNAANALSVGKTIAVAAGTLFSDPLSTLYQSTVFREGETRLGMTQIEYSQSLTINEAVFSQQTNTLVDSLQTEYGPTVGPNYDLIRTSNSFFVSTTALWNGSVHVVTNGVGSNIQWTTTISSNTDQYVLSYWNTGSNYYNAWSSTPTADLQLEIEVFQTRSNLSLSSNVISHTLSNNSFASLHSMIGTALSDPSRSNVLSFAITRPPQFGAVRNTVTGLYQTVGRFSDLPSVIYTPYSNIVQLRSDTLEISFMALELGADTSNYAGFLVGTVEVTINNSNRTQRLNVTVAGPQNTAFLLQPGYFDILTSNQVTSNIDIQNLSNIEIRIDNTLFTNESIELNSTYAPGKYQNYLASLNEQTDVARQQVEQTAVQITASPLGVLTQSSNIDIATNATVLSNALPSNTLEIEQRWNILLLLQNIYADSLSPEDIAAIADLKTSFFDQSIWLILRSIIELPPLSTQAPQAELQSRVDLIYGWNEAIPSIFSPLYSAHNTIFQNYFERTTVNFPTYGQLSSSCNITLFTPLLGTGKLNDNLTLQTYNTVEVIEENPTQITLVSAPSSNDRIVQIAWNNSLRPVLSDTSLVRYSVQTEALELLDPYRTNYMVHSVFERSDGATGYSNIEIHVPSWTLSRPIHTCGPPTSTPIITNKGSPQLLASNITLISPQNITLLTINGVFQSSNVEVIELYDPLVGVYTEFIERTAFTASPPPTGSISIITKKFYNFEGSLYETSFEQQPPVGNTWFVETRSRYYNPIYTETVSRIVEDINTTLDFIIPPGTTTKELVGQQVEIITKNEVLNSNAVLISTPVQFITRTDITYTVSSVTSNILPHITLDRTHVYPLPVDLDINLQDGLSRLPSGKIIRRGSNVITSFQTSNQIVWHPYQSSVLSTTMNREVLLDQYSFEAPLSDLFTSPPSGATHIVISSIDHGIVLDETGRALVDAIPLEKLPQHRYLYLGDRTLREDTLVFCWSFGAPLDPWTPYSAPQKLSCIFAIGSTLTPVWTNQGLVQNIRQLTIPSRPFPSTLDTNVEVYWTSGGEYIQSQSQPYLFAFVDVPPSGTVLTYDLRRISDSTVLLSNQSLLIQHYTVHEFPALLELLVTNSNVEPIGLQSLWSASNTSVPLHIAIAELPRGVYLKDTENDVFSFTLDTSRSTSYMLQQNELLPTSASLSNVYIKGYYFVPSIGISDIRKGSLEDRRVFFQNIATYQNEVQYGESNVYTGAPLLPFASPNVVDLDVQLDQAGQFALFAPDSIRGEHPYPLRLYAVTSPSNGVICDKRDGRPVSGWFESSNVIYQHRGASIEPDALTLYVTSANFTPADRAWTLNIRIQVRALPTIELVQATQFIETLPAEIPIIAGLSALTLPEGITLAAGSSNLMVTNLNNFVNGSLPLPLSVSPSNALIQERPTEYQSLFTLPYEIRINTIYRTNELTAPVHPYNITYFLDSGEVFRDYSVILSFQVLFDTDTLGFNKDRFTYDVYDFSLKLRLLDADANIVYEYPFTKSTTELYRFDVYQRLQIELAEGAVPVIYLNDRVIPGPPSDSILTGLVQVRQVQLYSDPIVLTKSGAWYADSNTTVPINYALSNAIVTTKLQNFSILLSPEETLDDTDTINIAIGQKINIQGNNNICIGKNFLTSGNNSIIVGNEIGIDDTNAESDVNSIFESILIGSSSFRNTVVRNVIGIGNNNLNNMLLTLSTDQVATFFSKGPIVIGNNIPANLHEFHVNIGNTFLKGDPGIYLGVEGERVRIGLSNTLDVRSSAELYVHGMVEAKKGVAAQLSFLPCKVVNADILNIVVSTGEVDSNTGLLQVTCSTSAADPGVIGVLYQVDDETGYIATRGTIELPVPSTAVIGSLLETSSIPGKAGIASAPGSSVFAKVVTPRNSSGNALCMLIL